MKYTNSTFIPNSKNITNNFHTTFNNLVISSFMDPAASENTVKCCMPFNATAPAN